MPASSEAIRQALKQLWGVVSHGVCLRRFVRWFLRAVPADIKVLLGPGIGFEARPWSWANKFDEHALTGAHFQLVLVPLRVRTVRSPFPCRDIADFRMKHDAGNCARIDDSKLIGLLGDPSVVDEFDHPAMRRAVDLILDGISGDFDRKDFANQTLETRIRDGSRAAGHWVGPGLQHLGAAMLPQPGETGAQRFPVSRREKQPTASLQRTLEFGDEFLVELDVARQQDHRGPWEMPP